jgi:hypothetical protein
VLALDFLLTPFEEVQCLNQITGYEYIPQKTTKRRGKVAKSDAHNLWDRLKKYATSVLLFAKLPHVSFTNKPRRT